MDCTNFQHPKNFLINLSCSPDYVNGALSLSKKNLTSEELEILELFHKPLHDNGDVLLEGVDLVSFAVLLQVFDDAFHVVLQVDGEVLLGAESGLGESVVQGDVDARDAALIGTLVGLFGAGVGAREDHLAFLAGLVLANDLVEAVGDEGDLVSVGEKFISCNEKAVQTSADIAFIRRPETSGTGPRCVAGLGL